MNEFIVKGVDFVVRIVSLCPSNTELLAYLGATSQLVGVDDYSDWPQEVNDLPRLGPDLSINIDKVKALKPDLVVASLSVPGMEANVDALKHSGLPYIVLNPNSLKEIEDDLITLGELIDAKQTAIKVAVAFHNIIDSYKKIAENIKEKPEIYWEWWPKPVFTPGGKNWLTEMSELAGAHNMYRHEDVASVKTNWLDVVEKDPDHICLIWVGVDPKKVKREFVLKREQSDTLNAVKNERIHLLEEPYFCRPSPRLLIGLRRIASLLHPELYPEFNPIDPILKAAEG